ncbi:efflux RND transporter periplasmic adaptor subunit [Ignavibacteria bacterium]|nr:efflux RND transporter periplasmic adaptor subunit [Bacteroidota bacterium]MCZ2131754.1 efflux RND transporter periplasmic adaptor subunit [Bacteroidota bacterium]
MKKIKLILFAVALLSISVAVKVFFFPNKTAPQGKPQGGFAAVAVNTYIVKPEKLGDAIAVSGTVLANEEANLVSEVSGKIISINLKEGQPASKGDLLVKINDADLQAQFKKLMSQLDLAKENEARMKKLLNIKGVSIEEYESAVNALNAARADIALVQAQIDKTEIRAPFAGTVGLKYAGEGSYTPVGVKIASIQQLDPVKIDFSVPEKYARQITKGDAVSFTVQSVPDTFEAKILAIEPKVDIATRTVQLRAVCSNKEKKLLPGSFAKITIILKELPNSIMIPTEALIPALKGYKVFVSKNGKAEESAVNVGIRTEKSIEVVRGLEIGDTVITTGIMQLKAGSPIKIIAAQ